MSSGTRGSRLLPSAIALALGLTASAVAAQGDISALDQHFNQPGRDISPWMFVPEENIKEFSTEEHPGLATIYEAGRGQDVKGILKDPIRIGDYRLPWEFQTSLVQSFNLTAGVGAKTQVNSAIGLNVAVTFSDPSDMAQRSDQATAADARVPASGRSSRLHGRGRRRIAAVLDGAASRDLSGLGSW